MAVSSSNEEKKALILRMNRVVMGNLCSKAGTQDPLLFVHPNADGTGSMTAIWESEDAWMKTLLPAIDPNGTITANMTYNQKKRFLLDGVAKTHNRHPPGVVNFTVMQEGFSPRLTKSLLSYPTYQELLDSMHADAKQMEDEAMQQQQQQQQQQASSSSSYAYHQQQLQQSILSNMQLNGAAPTHYQNGIPHYGGIHF